MSSRPSSPTTNPTSTRPHSPNSTLASSPPPFSIHSEPSSQKPKGKPTVTPRTFTRFFTPRSPAWRRKTVGSSRQALQDITQGASNGRTAKRRKLAKDTVMVDGEEDLGFEDIKFSKKGGGQSTKVEEPDLPSSRATQVQPVGEESEDSEEEQGEDKEVLKPVIRSKYRGQLGAVLRRQLDEPWQPARRGRVRLTVDWQDSTSNFYSLASDRYQCTNRTLSTRPDLPFCTTALNTNTLIAVGDEGGTVTLLETSPTSSPPFSKAYLSFQCAENAIVDMALSPDDRTLALACADHKSHVVDMMTQKTACVLTTHSATLKQIRFQPGTGDKVIATSARDGRILLYDLRCNNSSLQPVLHFHTPSDATHTSSGAPLRQRISSPLRCHTPTKALHAPHAFRTLPLPPASSSTTATTSSPIARTGPVSVTAMEFLPPPRAHLLLTASEANAALKLWDMRNPPTTASRQAPLSTTRVPEAHHAGRQYGINGMALSGRGDRIFTLCKDNTVYAYSTAHLVLGHSATFDADTADEIAGVGGGDRRTIRGAGPGRRERHLAGLGPLFALRHPRLLVFSFYEKLALRPARGDAPELLAVGSGDCTPIVFPTAEEHHRYRSAAPDGAFEDHLKRHLPHPAPQVSLADEIRNERIVKSRAFLEGRDRKEGGLEVSMRGTALVGGHANGVTGLCWGREGGLVSASDDCSVRVWREDRELAEGLRGGWWGRDKGGRLGLEGRRGQGCGWAQRDGESGGREDEEDEG